MQTKVEREEAIQIPAPPENLARRMTVGTALAFFGPGAIIAALVAKGAMVYASNHYITVTGEHPMSRFAKIFPGPRGWFPILIGVLAIASFPSFASGLSVGLGTYFQDLGWGSAQVWAIGLILVAAALAYLGGYEPLEKVQIAIVGLLILLVIVAMFVTRPDWLGLLGGLIPSLPEYQPWVAQKYPDIAARPEFVELVVFLGSLGGGMYDYVGYTGLL